MGVSTTQLGASVSSADPSSTVTQPRTCETQPCVAVRLELDMGEGRLILGYELKCQTAVQVAGIWGGGMEGGARLGI